jgi:hypothetical protein
VCVSVSVRGVSVWEYVYVCVSGVCVYVSGCV